MPLAMITLQSLPPAFEQQLRSKHQSEVELLLPIVGPVMGFLMIAFAMRDYLIDPVHAPQSLALRLACVAVAALAFWRTPLRWSPTQRAGFIYWIYAGGIVAIGNMIEGGIHDATVSVAASVFLVSLVSLSAATFLWILSVPFLMFVALGASALPFPEFLNTVVSYVLSIVLALVLMLMFRFFRVKAFVLELQLSYVARHDSLTGLFNRGCMTELAAREMARARRHQRPLAVAMLDIDHFKRINDTYGHEAGDRVLKALADSLRAHLREVDMPGRIGGEEFLCLLPETGESEALACAERLRASIEALTVGTPQGPVRLTASIGVAVLGAEHADWESLQRDADAALYQSKHNGRNRVSLTPLRTAGGKAACGAGAAAA